MNPIYLLLDFINQHAAVEMRVEYISEPNGPTIVTAYAADGARQCDLGRLSTHDHRAVNEIVWQHNLAMMSAEQKAAYERASALIEESFRYSGQRKRESYHTAAEKILRDAGLSHGVKRQAYESRWGRVSLVKLASMAATA